MKEGYTDKLRLWYTVDVPKESKAIVFVLHGMMEHSSRYALFFRTLVDSGYGYAAIDLPGHGKSSEDFGGKGAWLKDGFEKCAEEINTLIIKLSGEYKKPVILFGHSMGSFLSIGYISKYGESVSGCILSGTNDRQPAMLISAGLYISKMIMKGKGDQHRSPLLDKMAFAGYNKNIKPLKTKYDWLTSVESEVETYIEDPYCGFLCSARFFNDFSIWLSKIYEDKQLSGIPDDLPVYIFSGNKDPVGNYGKGPGELRNRLGRLGINNTILRIYEGLRHECLNETKREEVMHHIIEFCDETVS